MTFPFRTATYRPLAIAGAVFCAIPILAVHLAETTLGMVPCAFCLVERKPWYAGFALAILAALLPPRLARILLWGLVGVFLAAAALHFVHSGVEWHFWPDPLPQCVVQDFRGMSMADRLAAMPARPAKPCEFADYPIDGIKLSFSNYGLIYALALSFWLAISLLNRRRIQCMSQSGPTHAAPLPGDPSARTATERMVRVDHAGEYGAKRIYQGQLAVLGKGPKGDILRHMQAQEQVHLNTFARLIGERRIRPTALLPFWHVAGFVLGAVTAALGTRAAMACTVAVEEAIDAHYRDQAEALGDDEAELRGTIERFRAEEREHRDIGLEHEAELTPAYRPLYAAIRAGCRVAIALSERL